MLHFYDQRERVRMQYKAKAFISVLAFLGVQ